MTLADAADANILGDVDEEDDDLLEDDSDPKGDLFVDFFNSFPSTTNVISCH